MRFVWPTLAVIATLALVTIALAEQQQACVAKAMYSKAERTGLFDRASSSYDRLSWGGDARPVAIEAEGCGFIPGL